MALVLYHHDSSVCAAKVRVALSEKGLSWESRLLALDGDQFAPDYLALNPAAVVPTLVHDGRVVTESSIILEYLDDAFPERPLRPADPYWAAVARRLVLHLDAGADSIHYCASVLTYGIAYRHKLLAQAGGTDRAALSSVIDRNMNPKSRLWLEDVVFDGIKAPQFGAALLRVDALLAEFETALAQIAWLSGPQYGLADASFTSYMVRFDLLQLGFLWSGRPHVAGWYDRLMSRQSAREVREAYHLSSVETLVRRGQEVAAEVAAEFRNARRSDAAD